MNGFPRTEVGGVSLSRMIVGTNWFFGYSHYTPAKDTYIKETVHNRKSIAAILEVFLRAGVNAVMGFANAAHLVDAVKDAEDRVGAKMMIVATPSLPTTREGFDFGEAERILDANAELGATFCMPHTSVTDLMVDRLTREIRQMDVMCRMIRERGMVPGLSTHLPESIIFADETELDVETYIAIYNLMGFLMPLEADWTANIIWKARKPVMTIKPMAAGQIRPFQAMNYVWNTLRPQDMVTVGTMTPLEAQELIDMSMAILERHPSPVKLQETRSKAVVKSANRG